MTRALFAALSVLALLPAAAAQPQSAFASDPRVPIAWNRYYDAAEIDAWLDRIQAAYPDLVRLETIGASREGRPLRVAIVNVARTGDDRAKPAMWIDGNVHGNEIQAAEAVLYTLWYLTRAYGENDDLTALLDRAAFYLLPSQNPDGRAHWFADAHTSSSSRGDRRPVDDDQDGRIDEDGPNDLDGDGSITTMWRADPDGDWIRDRHDPRIFRRVEPDQKGDWTRLGSEGIDDDGDGRVNEDPPGGDDLNRDWPSDWQPEYVQHGAGPYPLSQPETRAIAAFLLDHPNVAAVQSYHNAGGMILRGPGADYRENLYRGADERAYAELGRIGEQLLPWYRSMVLWKDLYVVHGGFVTWTAEGLGIFSFTNEMWSYAKYFQRDEGDDDADRMWLFHDRLQFGDVFTDYTEREHPQYGTVLVGGLDKWASRSTPTFMLEEECHRNFAFTMYHADQMPLVSFARHRVEALGGGAWSLTVQVENARLLPTRSGMQEARGIGAHDRLEVDGARVLAGGTVERMDAPRMDAVRHEPARLQIPGGIPGHGFLRFRFLLEAPAGAAVTLRYVTEKAQDVETRVRLE